MRLTRTTTPRITQQGKASARHVGLYHWCNYWHNWDKVLSVTAHTVTVVKCDDCGAPVPGEPVRTHWTAMDMAMFADKPFDITRG